MALVNMARPASGHPRTRGARGEVAESRYQAMMPAKLASEPSMPGKTLDELENLTWGEPAFDSYLVATCHRLRKKPVDEFTVEDLRIMIGQTIGLEFLLPRAIDVLEREPLAAGDFFVGDLLVNVIACVDWLRTHPHLLHRVASVVKRAAAESGEQHGELHAALLEFLARIRA